MIMKGFFKEYNSITPSQFLNPDLQYKSSPRQTKKTTVSPQEKEKCERSSFPVVWLTYTKKDAKKVTIPPQVKEESERSSFLVLSHTHTKATSTFHFLIPAHDFFIPVPVYLLKHITLPEAHNRLCLANLTWNLMFTWR